MIKKYLLAGAVFVSLSSSAFAVKWKDSPYVEIKKLYPNNGGLNFYTEYKDESVSACDGGYRFDIPASAQNYDTKVSVIMAAFMAKKKILIRYDAEQTKKCAAVVDRFLVKP
ncbi:hypothetical protein [Vibrio diabolicus]|uniref:hypothetical protein n=1 Tax=Vibrio diabolicus TaxID=50719 RepID=UPI001CD964F5|nr:hypothetical protein [Vibrio diabolicus]